MGLCLGVTVKQSDDQPLRQSSTLGGVHGISNGLVESAYRSVDVLAHRESVAKAGYVGHASTTRK